MIVDLVQVFTRDGVRLDGALRLPASNGSSQLPVTACLLIHGTGGCFYSSALFDGLAERLIELGSAVLRVNTRGHDLMSTATTSQGGRRLGAAYELVDECRHDIDAWLGWLGQRGFAEICLVGHSLGAVKSVYVLAREPHPAVRALVALSPPRLSYSHFRNSASAAEFLATFAEAEQHVQAGRSSVLMEVKFPLPFVVTAGGYVEKYGLDERYDFLKFLPRVNCPTLVTFGSRELQDNVAFCGVPELIAQSVNRAGVALEVIPGADHFYTTARSEVVEQVERWLRTRTALLAPMRWA
jgi:dienelactone hydrolase